MDAIVLAGGFARRMWPLTKETPKQLLPVGDKPMLAHVLRALEPVAPTRVLLSVNAAFAAQFRAFADAYDGPLALEVAVEAARSEGEKPGALGALEQLIAARGLTGPLFIAGGDNLCDFALDEMVAHHRTTGCDVIGLYDVGDRALAQLYGIAARDGSRITALVEKPADPPSTLTATAFWLLSRDGVAALLRYLAEGGERDALGHFLTWRVRQATVESVAFRGTWFDIGGLESYRAACAWVGNA